MLPDPAKPQLEEPPKRLVQKPGTLVPGLGFIAFTLAFALLTHRRNKKHSELLPDTSVSRNPVEPQATAPVNVAAFENSDSSLAQAAESKLPNQSKPFKIDIKSNLVDYGGLIVGFLSLAATVAIAVYASLINQKQTKILEVQSNAAITQSNAAIVQAEAATDEVNIRFVEEFRERIRELTLPTDNSNDENYEENFMRKSLAIIALAQYGERVLPALKMALKARDPLLRDSAADVLAHMLSNHKDKPSRVVVFSALLKYFDENDADLRLGILKCFVMMYKELSIEEVTNAKATVKKHILPDADLTDRLNDQKVLIEAAKFFGNYPSSDSTAFLLAIVKNQLSGDGPRTQAINYLPDVVKGAQDLTPEQRADVVNELQKLLLLSDKPELATKISNAISAIKR